jgi:hypothetical protein
MKSFAAIRSLSRIGRHAAALVSVAVAICGARTEAAVISIVPSDAIATVTIDGPLTFDDGAQFQAKTTALTKAVVVLSSDGGSVAAGITIGETIRRKGFQSFVSGRCASACALAWLGGTPRSGAAEAQIGFHAVYNDKTGQVSGAGNARVGAYLRDLDLPDEAVFYITKAAPTTMSWLTLSEAKKNGIDVTLVDKSAILEASDYTWDPRAKPYEPPKTGMFVAVLVTIFWCGVFATAYYFLVPFLERRKFFGRESVPQSKKMRIIMGVLLYFATSVGVNLAKADQYQDWWVLVIVIALAVGGSSLLWKGRSSFFTAKGEAPFGMRRNVRTGRLQGNIIKTWLESMTS